MYTEKNIVEKKFRLSEEIKETSGLIYWDDLLWTMKDHNSPNLFALDPKSGKIVKKVHILNANCFDWEDLAQDSRKIYIGDFGDNDYKPKSKKRTIYSISKDSILVGKDTLLADTLHFIFEGFYNNRGYKVNHTNFDCEAMISFGDSLYLFTKQWINKHTTVYSLPKERGFAVARKVAEYNVDALITGACFSTEDSTIALSGYHTDRKSYLTPFVYLLSNFKGNQFFSGDVKKIYIGKPFHQVEAVATKDGKEYFFTNEALFQQGIGIPAYLMKCHLKK